VLALEFIFFCGVFFFFLPEFNVPWCYTYEKNLGFRIFTCNLTLYMVVEFFNFGNICD